MSATRTARWDLRALVGSGDAIALFTLPFLIGGVILNIASPSIFDVGGPPAGLGVVCILALVPGVAVWLWSVALIVTRVPRGELITTGPYALVKHPIYTAVAILVIPPVGLLLNTWLGAAIGAVVYAASRMYAPAEEAELSRTFGAAWDDYRRRVKIPWL